MADLPAILLQYHHFFRTKGNTNFGAWLLLLLCLILNIVNLSMCHFLS